MRLAWRSWLAICYSVAFSVALLYLAWAGSEFNNEFWLTLVQSKRMAFPNLPIGRMALEAIGMIAILGVLSRLIARIDHKFAPDRLVGANLNFRLLFNPWLRYPFAVLLIWDLPILATLEEFIFRQGGWGWHGPVTGLQDVLVRSLAFGLFHALMSWNFRGGVMQTILSFWFSYQYLSGAPDPLVYASFSHFLVDLFALVPGVLALCLKPSAPACS